jgi:hypothetical protein
MDTPAIPVFLAGPFPVLQHHKLDEDVFEVELDVALLISGLPSIIASSIFPLDETWERVLAALRSGDARLGVAGVPHPSDSDVGEPMVYPSAFIGLECANGERLVLSHIRGLDSTQDAESYAREVIDSVLLGHSPEELGVTIDD